MGITRRLYNVMRANLNAAVDRAAGWSAESGRLRLEDLSDAALEAELARRRTRRSRRASEEAAIDRQAWQEAEEAARPSGRYRSSRDRGFAGETDAASARSRVSDWDRSLARLYAQLECPYGADLPTVRKHYRRLMRQYHPDLHASHPEKQRIATDLTQRLTAAYNELRRALTGS